MRRQLSQLQRIIAAVVYIFVIVVIYSVLNGSIADFINQPEPISVWFFSGILLIVMGMYVTEPYFSSPTDTFSNSISLILVLVSLNNKQAIKGYWGLLIYAYGMFLLSFFHMIIKNYNEKAKRITYWCLKNLGSSKIMFSIVYLDSSISFFYDDVSMLIVAIAIWICMVPIGVVEKAMIAICQLVGIVKDKDANSSLGIVERNLESNLFTVAVSKTQELEYDVRGVLYAIKADDDSYCLGMEIQRKISVDLIWITLKLIDNANIKIKKSELNNNGLSVNYNEPIGSVHMLNEDRIDQSIISRVFESRDYIDRDDFIGFILPDSNINVIRFSTCRENENRIAEGTIVRTFIFGMEVLYQVINGITKIDNNDNDSKYGYMCVVARKLGNYDYKKCEILQVNWTPKAFESVYICKTREGVDLKNIANTSIGRLPGSDMGIPIKDINALVTHNTAVLGILGVGKSCLTFELIKKIVDSGIKVVCLDITNQYASNEGLYGYIDEKRIVSDLLQCKIDELKEKANRRGTSESKSTWGNVEDFKRLMEEAVSGFLKHECKDVMVINPEKYIVKQAATDFRITELKDISLVEKVQIISEILLENCMAFGQIDKARCCVVYEEAHSLTPEFTSVVVKDDNAHANGTAKVILQGRKYGLGCIIVTQRTANVTKSILNQCNTIFALRVFDDTGKTFLENYIGKDYSDTLPTLEERHAIAIGKGIGLKQPVIMQLNDMKYIKTKEKTNCNNGDIMSDF